MQVDWNMWWCAFPPRLDEILQDKVIVNQVRLHTFFTSFHEMLSFILYSILYTILYTILYSILSSILSSIIYIAPGYIGSLLIKWLPMVVFVLNNEAHLRFLLSNEGAKQVLLISKDTTFACARCRATHCPLRQLQSLCFCIPHR